MVTLAFNRLFRRAAYAPLAPWTAREVVYMGDKGPIAGGRDVTLPFKFCGACGCRIPRTSRELCRWCDSESTWRTAA